MSDICLQGRYAGAMLGLAAGDALGTTLEFQPPGSFTPIDDMVGGGPFDLPPGHWTDDTSMALCLAESLIQCRGFNPTDQMERYVRWWKEGYFSCTGRCFDIGVQTVSALRQFQQTREPFAPPAGNSAGNGCIMRLAPTPLAFAQRPAEAIEYAAESSRTTHPNQPCLDAARFFAGLLVGALQGRAKAELLAADFRPEGVPNTPLHREIAEIAAGSYKHREPPAIRAGGYVVHALEAALWAFSRTDNFRAGALLAVNLGDDADTVGAIYGQVAGAYYGVESIPIQWRYRLARRDWLDSAAERLYRMAWE